MSIVAECGLWLVLVSNNVVYNSVLLYEMPWAAEPWVMAQPEEPARFNHLQGVLWCTWSRILLTLCFIH